MPVTAKYALTQANGLGVCQCGGSYPNNPVIGVATDPRWPRPVYVPVPPGTFFGPTQADADDDAQQFGDDEADDLLNGYIEDAEDLARSTAGLSCHKKEGIATLIGFDEYDYPGGVSDPRKLWRRQTLDGEYNGCAFSLPGCNGNALNRREFYSGYYQFNAEDGTTENTQFQNVKQDTSVPCGTASTDVSSGSIPADLSMNFRSTGEIDITIQPTSKTYEGNGDCVSNDIISGDWSASLTDEDSEDDAEDRAMLALEDTDWLGCGLGCGDDLDATCAAYRSDRSGTDDIDFGFRVVETRVSLAAKAQCSYGVTIQFGRRTLGSGGPFLELGLIYEVTLTAGEDDGVIESEWIEVPNEAGYETRANSVEVSLIPFIP